MLTARRHLLSLAEACRLAHTTPERFVEAAEAIGVQAAETINHAPLIESRDVQRVVEHLAAERPGGGGG